MERRSLAVALVADWASRVQPPTPRPSSAEHRLQNARETACDARFPEHPCRRMGPHRRRAHSVQAWPIAAVSIGLAWPRPAASRVAGAGGAPCRARAALWPLWAVAAFLVKSKVTVGAWFVSSGFFVPENPSLGHPWGAWTDVWNDLLKLTGPALPWIATASACAAGDCRHPLARTGSRARRWRSRRAPRFRSRVLPDIPFD